MREEESGCPLRIAVMVSGHGRGTNLAAIMMGCASGEIEGEVVLVIGTRADAPALQLAHNAGVSTAVVSPRKYDGDDEAYGEALLKLLARRRPGLLCLAGYMRMLPPAVLAAYNGKVMNIHAALLPLFGGKGMYGEHVHRAVLESGMKVTGCTVHFVDEQYDTGPIILQSPVHVLDGDTPESLAARVLMEEHKAYVRAVKLFAEESLRLSPDGRRVLGAYPGDMG